MVSYCTYSRVPNKRTGRLLANGKKPHLYALIQDYTFINFQQKVPPICLFPPILLLFLYFHGPIQLPFKTFLWPIMTSDDRRSHFEATFGNLKQKLFNCRWIFYCNSMETLLIATKNPNYTFIQTYTFNIFLRKVPPTLVCQIDVHARLLILRKNFPLHGLIWVGTFIDFEKKFPPARLFGSH